MFLLKSLSQEEKAAIQIRLCGGARRLNRESRFGLMNYISSVDGGTVSWCPTDPVVICIEPSGKVRLYCHL